MVEEKESFADLEKIRLDILQERIKEGLAEFNTRPGIQWTTLRLEKPLFESLLSLVEEKAALRTKNA